MCVECGGTGRPGDEVIDETIEHPFELKPETDHLCLTCDRHISVHPDKYDYLSKKTMDDIIAHGHQVRWVFGEGPDFGYTIGRSVKDRPELLITGPLDPRVGQWVLNEAAAMDEKEPLYAGQEIPANELLNEHPVRIVEVKDLEAAEMFGVTEHFSDATALQIIWPDMEGRFPGDEGFAFADAQPVFS